MDDLLTWLRAQLDAREAKARAATPGPWLRGLGTVVEQAEGDDPHLVAEMNVCADHEDRREADAEFIADNDPEFVLADVAAKRKLLQLHECVLLEHTHPLVTDAHLTKERLAVCASCEPPSQFRRTQSWPCPTLKVLALPFAGRPGWREEWRA